MTPTRLLGEFLWPHLGDGVDADQLAANVLRLLDQNGLLLLDERAAKIRADEAEQCAQAIDAHAARFRSEHPEWDEALDAFGDAAIIVRRRIPPHLKPEDDPGYLRAGWHENKFGKPCGCDNPDDPRHRWK